ncbi:uncharacterized protein DAT39_001516, partial [Clarias magur]
IEDIIKSSPGGEKVLNEYSRTKGPSDARRRDMVKILVAYLRNEHGTSSSRRLKDEYAKGIISLFPCLADPRSKLGFMIKDIIKSSPGGEKVLNEYSHTKGPSDARRRDMVKILVAYLRNEHGTSSSQRLKDEYAKGIISLFPCLADHRSKLGY